MSKSGLNQHLKNIHKVTLITESVSEFLYSSSRSSFDGHSDYENHLNDQHDLNLFEHMITFENVAGTINQYFIA